jgi:glycerate dehydrogenase
MSVWAMTSKSASDLPVGIQKATLDDLLAHSDILTLHCPLTEDTREMINKESLAQMKRGAILINTGRGPLVNEIDVAQALQSGRLAAYGADVLCQEPPSDHTPLLDLPNAFITPHIAWATVEARRRLIEVAVDNVRAFIQGHPVNQVNAIP